MVISSQIPNHRWLRVEMIGSESRLPFALLFSIRSRLVANRFLALFTIISIAISVALATGLQMSSHSIEAELERTAEALGGAAQIQVSGGAIGIPEQLIDTVAAVPGVLAVSPLIQATMRLDDPKHRGQPLRVLGVDFTSDQKIRTYTITRDDLEVRDPLLLLAAPNSVIITRSLASRIGVEQGSSLPVRLGDRALSLTVQGILSKDGLGEAFDGQVAIMDVFAIQRLQAREGWVDRIDVVPRRGVDVEFLQRAVGEAVAGRATAGPAGRRAFFVEQVMGTLRLGVWMFVLVSVVVAASLAYATMSISVDRRIEELALLQAAGLEPRRVRRFVYVDAAMLSLLGTLIGLGIGFIVSGWLLSFFSKASEQLQVAGATRLEVPTSSFIVAAIVGVAISLVATVEPAMRATARPPLDVLLGARRPAANESPRLPSVALVLSLGGVALVCTTGWMPIPALLRLGGLFFASIAIVVLVFGVHLPAIIGQLTRVLELIPRVGPFLGTSLAIRPVHTGLTIASLVAVVSGLGAALITLDSITLAIHDYIASRYPGAVLVTATDLFAELNPDPLPAKAVEAIRQTPGVVALLESFNTQVLYDGVDVQLNARSMSVLADYGRLPVVGGDPRQLARKIAAGGIAVSESFSRRFRLGVGDTLMLDTPMGTRSFSIVGICRAFVGTGAIEMDIRTFDSLWERPGALAAVIWTSGSETQVISLIREKLGKDYALFFTKTDEYAEYSARTIDRFVALLYLLAGFTALLGGIAILNLLIGSVSERRREFALLRAAGATRPIIGTIVLLDGLVIAAVGILGGLALAAASSQPMCAILEETVGWDVAPVVRWSELGLLAGLVALVSAATSLYPAWSASRHRGFEMFASE